MEISTSKSITEREDEGVLVHVNDENIEPQFEDGKPVTLRVVGTYSKVFRKAKARQREKNMKRGKAAYSGESLSRQELEVTAECVLPVDFGPFTSDGKPFPHSKENVIALLDSCPWIREQVEEAMGDHAGFSKAPSSS